MEVKGGGDEGRERVVVVRKGKKRKGAKSFESGLNGKLAKISEAGGQAEKDRAKEEKTSEVKQKGRTRQG